MTLIDFGVAASGDDAGLGVRMGVCMALDEIADRPRALPGRVGFRARVAPQSPMSKKRRRLELDELGADPPDAIPAPSALTGFVMGTGADTQCPPLQHSHWSHWADVARPAVACACHDQASLTAARYDQWAQQNVHASRSALLPDFGVVEGDGTPPQPSAPSWRSKRRVAAAIASLPCEEGDVADEYAVTGVSLLPDDA